MSRPFGLLPQPKPRFRRPVASASLRRLARSLLHLSFLFGWIAIMLVVTPAGDYLFKAFWPNEIVAPVVHYKPTPEYELWQKLVQLQSQHPNVHLSQEEKAFLELPLSYRKPLTPEEQKHLILLLLKYDKLKEFSQVGLEHPLLLPKMQEEILKQLQRVPASLENWHILQRVLYHAKLDTTLAKSWLKGKPSPYLRHELEEALRLASMSRR